MTTTTFVSVDGVMQEPGGPDEDRSGGFERGGWTTPLLDNDAATLLNQVYQRADAFLFGRKTYEIFPGPWGAVADPSINPIAAALNTMPKYVASTTLTDPRWADTTVLYREVAAAVGELKARPGRELRVHGSGAPIRWLLDSHLVDEITLLTFPVIVGQGTRLFPRHRPGHSPRTGRVASHPQRCDHPGLPADRAPGVPSFERAHSHLLMSQHQRWLFRTTTCAVLPGTPAELLLLITGIRHLSARLTVALRVRVQVADPVVLDSLWQPDLEPPVVDEARTLKRVIGDQLAGRPLPRRLKAD